MFHSAWRAKRARNFSAPTTTLMKYRRDNPALEGLPL
jgi:hypothetical protein